MLKVRLLCEGEHTWELPWARKDLPSVVLGQMDRLPGTDGFICFHELVRTSQLFGSDLTVASNYAVVMFCDSVERMQVRHALGVLRPMLMRVTWHT
jgi:hypothetical protein